MSSPTSRSPFREHLVNKKSTSSSPQGNTSSLVPESDPKGSEVALELDNLELNHEANDENLISATYSYSPSKRTSKTRNTTDFHSSGRSRSMDAEMIAAMRMNSSLIDVTTAGTANSFASSYVADEEPLVGDEGPLVGVTCESQCEEHHNVPPEAPYQHPTRDDLAVLEKPVIARQQAEVTSIFSSDNPFEGLIESQDEVEQKPSFSGFRNDIIKVETVTSEDSADIRTEAMDPSTYVGTIMSIDIFDVTSEEITEVPSEFSDGEFDVFKPPKVVTEKAASRESMATMDVTKEEIIDAPSECLEGEQDVFKPPKDVTELAVQNPFDQFVPTRPSECSGDSCTLPEQSVSSGEEDCALSSRRAKSPIKEICSSESESISHISSKEDDTIEPESISGTTPTETSCDQDAEIVPNASSDAFSGLDGQFDNEPLSGDATGAVALESKQLSHRPIAANLEDKSTHGLASANEDESATVLSGATDKTPRINNLEIQAPAMSPMSPKDRYLMAVRRAVSNKQAFGPLSPRDRYLMAIKQAAEKGKAMASTPKEVVTGPSTTPVKAQVRIVENGGFRSTSRSFERSPSSRSFERSPSSRSFGRSPSSRRSFERSPTRSLEPSPNSRRSVNRQLLGKDETEDEEQPVEFGLPLFENVTSAAELHVGTNSARIDHHALQDQPVVHPKDAPSAFHSFQHDVSHSSSGELPVKEEVDAGNESYLQLDLEAAAPSQPLEAQQMETKPSGTGPFDSLRSSLAMIWNSKPIPSRLPGSQTKQHHDASRKRGSADPYTSLSSPVGGLTNDMKQTDKTDTQAEEPHGEVDACCEVPSESGSGAMESLRSSLKMIWNSKPRPTLMASTTTSAPVHESLCKSSPPGKSNSIESHSKSVVSQEQGHASANPSYGRCGDLPDSKRGRVLSEDSSDASSYKKTQKKKTRRIDGLSARQKLSARETMGNQYLISNQSARSPSRERTVTPIPSGEDLCSPGLLGDTGRRSYDSLEDLNVETGRVSDLYRKPASYRKSPKASNYRASLSPVRPASTTETENSFINAALTAQNVNDMVVIYSDTPETRDWHPPEQERKEHDTMVRAILERPSLIDKSISEPFQPRQLDWRVVRKWTLVTMAMLFFLAVIAGCLACGITGNCARREMNVAEEEQEFQPLVLDLPPYTQESLKSLHTAQTKAYFWLENDPYRNTYSDSRKMQRFALATLYYSTKIAQNWTVSTSWLAYDIHECYWFSSYEGMDVCENDQIKHLVLKKNNLRGNIPPELALLTSLVELDLSRNVLIGPIPEQLQELTALEQLWLEKNELNGDIPSEIGTMTNLKSLALATNDLKGTIPSEVAVLTNLETLRLFYNFLTGTVPTEIAYLTGLKLLDVDVNNLSGTIPTQLGLLSNLQELWLDWNSFVGPIPTELGLLSNLVKLYLGRAFVGEDLRDEEWRQSRDYLIPTELGLLTKIEELYLDNNDLTGMIPTELSALTNLQRATLDNNFLTDSISPGICSLFGGQLESLSIDCSEVLCSCGCTCV